MYQETRINLGSKMWPLSLDKLWNVSFNQPDLGAAVLEELQKFGNHDVKRPIESITVQQLGRVLTDLLQSSKGALCVKMKTHVTQLRQVESPLTESCPTTCLHFHTHLNKETCTIQNRTYRKMETTEKDTTDLLKCTHLTCTVVIWIEHVTELGK